MTHLRGELDRAVQAREAGRHDVAVRVGYEMVEQALKAALLYVGVAPPAWINVGPQLEEHEQKFPPQFRAELDIAVYAARVSWEAREPGIGAKGSGDLEDDDEYDSESALETAGRVLAMVEDLVRAG